MKDESLKKSDLEDFKKDIMEALSQLPTEEDFKEIYENHIKEVVV